MGCDGTLWLMMVCDDRGYEIRWNDNRLEVRTDEIEVGMCVEECVGMMMVGWIGNR